MSVVFTVISYIADFLIGFYSNKAWDYWKEKKNRGNTSFSLIKSADNTVTIDAHITARDNGAMDPMMLLSSTIIGAREKVAH